MVKKFKDLLFTEVFTIANGNIPFKVVHATPNQKTILNGKTGETTLITKDTYNEVFGKKWFEIEVKVFPYI